jgi:hypothetical protein
LIWYCQIRQSGPNIIALTHEPIIKPLESQETIWLFSLKNPERNQLVQRCLMLNVLGKNNLILISIFIKTKKFAPQVNPMNNETYIIVGL